MRRFKEWWNLRVRRVPRPTKLNPIPVGHGPNGNLCFVCDAQLTLDGKCTICHSLWRSDDRTFTDLIRAGKESEGIQAARFFGVTWGNQEQRELGVLLYNKWQMLAPYRT